MTKSTKMGDKIFIGPAQYERHQWGWSCTWMLIALSSGLAQSRTAIWLVLVATASLEPMQVPFQFGLKSKVKSIATSCSHDGAKMPENGQEFDSGEGKELQDLQRANFAIAPFLGNRDGLPKF
ncbi:hypothetical protein [uncultured Cohaesibacter sp.]|uniref:hypothetical protein n=1 Tax=uncultured Cohaesibacter sp. TaxID=1002546 RepID=UPI0029C7A221|nr:hypothetical protein [uncultured Cohaesibacter sp.]